MRPPPFDPFEPFEPFTPRGGEGSDGWRSGAIRSGGAGASELEALPVRAAVLAEELGLLRGLDALGDGLQVEGRGRSGRSRHDGVAVVAVG